MRYDAEKECVLDDAAGIAVCRRGRPPEDHGIPFAFLDRAHKRATANTRYSDDNYYYFIGKIFRNDAKIDAGVEISVRELELEFRDYLKCDRQKRLWLKETIRAFVEFYLRNNGFLAPVVRFK